MACIYYIYIIDRSIYLHMWGRIKIYEAHCFKIMTQLFWVNGRAFPRSWPHGWLIAGILRIFVRQMQSVIFLLTCIAAVASYSLGDKYKAAILVFVVLFVIVLNTVGEYSSQDAGNALCKMAAPQTACTRDGREVLIEAAALVVGDWLVLSECK